MSSGGDGAGGDGGGGEGGGGGFLAEIRNSLCHHGIRTRVFSLYLAQGAAAVERNREVQHVRSQPPYLPPLSLPPLALTLALSLSPLCLSPCSPLSHPAVRIDLSNFSPSFLSPSALLEQANLASAPRKWPRRKPGNASSTAAATSSRTATPWQNCRRRRRRRRRKMMFSTTPTRRKRDPNLRGGWCGGTSSSWRCCTPAHFTDSSAFPPPRRQLSPGVSIVAHSMFQPPQLGFLSGAYRPQAGDRMCWCCEITANTVHTARGVMPLGIMENASPLALWFSLWASTLV